MGHLPEAQRPAPREVGLEVLERYDLVEVDESTGVIYLAEKDSGTSEISASGYSRYRRTSNYDYHPALAGVRAMQTYKEMKNDAVVRSSLRVAKTPILSARWFMEAASDDPIDQEIADFIWDNLTKWMSISWSQFLVEALFMLDYGVYAFEKVFNFKVVNGERRVVWQKFAPRHPGDIIEFVYDDEGGPAGVIIQTDEDDVLLPIDKALLFTFDKEAGDLWGHSVLRSAYKHWFYKENLYKIDAIQKERHGIGIPIIKLPPNFTATDKAVAEKIGVNLRTNEKAHVVLPPSWDVFFLKLEGQRVDALESAQHHADKLYENVLANFLMTNQKGDAEVQEQMFVRAVRFTAEIIRDVLNHYAIRQLCDLNWNMEERPGYPELRVRRLGDERDWRTLSFALRNLIGAGVIQVDQRLEDWARDEMDMPKLETDTIRQVASPQQPRVGLPRQSTAPGSQQGKRTENVGRAGRDTSGGN